MGGCLSSNSNSSAAPAPGAVKEGKKSAAAKKQTDHAGRPTSSTNSVLGKDTPEVKSIYDFGRTLGKGQFGTTRLVTDKKIGEVLACKSISKRKLVTPEDIADVQREVQIMHHLAGHPNVVTLRGAYEDKHHVHIVMEVCQGGELFDRIVERGSYTEKDAAEAIRTIVKVVQHCHNMNVIHRDLKPENFLLTDKTEAANIKATDFGLSVFFKDSQAFKDIVGSAYYVAPEVLRRNYGKEADIWSCGVMLYILLSGMPPFYGDNEQQIFDAVLRNKPDFDTDPWPKLSGPAKDCVKRMLVRDPSKRATAAEVLAHEWIKENGVAGDNEIEPEVLKRIRGFAAMNKLKKEALKVIAANLPMDEITGLKEMFHSMDKDASGTITVDEMRDGLRAKGSKIPESELQRIMENADVNGDGKVDYEEFLAATMHLGKLEREENLYRAFQFFDKDGSGYITIDELQTALKEHGDAAAVAAHIKDILADVDKDNDGRIDYEEFCSMMRQGNEEVLKAASTLKAGILGVKAPHMVASPRVSTV
ncbi:hypothetical protein OEZ85_008288 [Tetradesmus obliquus]|uniref:Calcium-dependent protein kinase n=1 Tax=Tetradesmus obliquus TaxID=3088 RepID=A0ABY8TKC0_TETOB|nr:hypothetical protein OEZ85_008288 [Tetradesmus obliquus]